MLFREARQVYRGLSRLGEARRGPARQAWRGEAGLGRRGKAGLGAARRV